MSEIKYFVKLQFLPFFIKSVLFFAKSELKKRIFN